MKNEINSGYDLPRFEFRRPLELDGNSPRHKVVIIGAGLTGLTLACDLANRGIVAVLVDDDDTVGVRGASSRGVVYSQKSLEIFDRLGIYDRIAKKGASWSIGKSLVGHDEIVYSFDAATQTKSVQPPFINIQQFYIEWYLVDRINELGYVDIRWKNTVLNVNAYDDHTYLEIGTPEGNYNLSADWVVDCSGIGSRTRNCLSVPVKTAKGSERWCISDVRFTKKLPPERWTWIESPVNDERAVWQHPLADDVWRIDFQMAPDSDLECVSRPDVCEERVRRLLGNDVEFQLVWVGPYSYQTLLLDSFRHKRVFFAGDSAHVFPPLGARGGNSGIQDADNLAWKLSLVTTEQISENILDTYNSERRPAAILNTKLATRSVRFLSPTNEGQRSLRKAIIALAKIFNFAQSMMNTGRMSTPYRYDKSNISNDLGQTVPNLLLKIDANLTVSITHLMRRSYFLIIRLNPLKIIKKNNNLLFQIVDVLDEDGGVAKELGIPACSIVLIRPDMHVCAVLNTIEDVEIKNAIDNATASVHTHHREHK